MNNLYRRYRIPAFTLAELLVFMIIAGILFLMITEGFSMIKRYSYRKSERIIAGSTAYGNYHRFAGIILSADSLASVGTDRFELYTQGDFFFEISFIDSLCVVSNMNTRDTMFKQVSNWEGIIRRHPYQADTLAITIAGNNHYHSSRLGFVINPSKVRIASELAVEKEKQYYYEDPNQQN